MAVAYPADLPISECLEIVSILRSGGIAAKKAKFAYDVWVLQGFAQKTILGDPTATLAAPPAPDVGIVLTPSAVPANFNVADELEKLCAGAGDIQAQMAVPWKQILQWALSELGTILLAA